MSNPYTELLNSFIQGVTTPPVAAPTKSEKESVAVPISTASTVSKSEAAAKQAALDSAYPMLAIPLVMPSAGFHQLFEASDAVGGSSVSALERGVEQSKNKIITRMLDAWLDSIKKEDLRRKDELNSSAYKNWLATQSPAARQERHSEELVSENTKVLIMSSAEYQAWIASLMPPTAISANTAAPAESLRVAVVKGLENYLQSVRGNSSAEIAITLPFMAASFVLGATALEKDYALVSPGAQTEIYAQGMHHLHNLVPDDARAELGLIGALFSIGLVYQATIESVLTPGKSEKRKGMTFARNYVRNVMKMITGEGTEKLIMNLLGDKMDQQRKNGILASMKLILLATALGVVYKIETGGISGKEFTAMLTGEMKLPESDLKADLVGYIKIQLSMIEPTEQERLLTSLIGFMDDDHNLDFMLNPSRVFERVLSDFSATGPINQPV